MGWATGEAFAIGVIVEGAVETLRDGLPDTDGIGPAAFTGLFMLAWLAGWTVGGAFAIYAWLWQVKGAEEVTISHDGLRIDKKTPIWTRSKEYRLRDVASLRLHQARTSMFNMAYGMEFWGITGGELAFDYGAKTVRFGIGLDEAEAKLVMKDIVAQAPSVLEGANQDSAREPG